MHPQRDSTPICAFNSAAKIRQKSGSYQASRWIRRGVAILALCIAGTNFMSTASAQVPALLQPTNPETHIGKIVFVELVTPDLNIAKRFYSSLFGWSFQTTQINNSDYAQATMNGYPVAGLIQKTIPDNELRQSAWLTFISVANVDAARSIALQHGAKILVEPRDVPNRGRQAVFADPQGAVFAVLASTSGDPADGLSEPGEWIWSSLISSDPDNAASFYQAIFDYEIFETNPVPGQEHLIMASTKYARASVNSLPTIAPNRHSHWINFVRVSDAVAMAARVVSLGGRVLVEPRIDRQGGKVAIVTDPGGAPFGLLEWPDGEQQEVAK